MSRPPLPILVFALVLLLLSPGNAPATPTACTAAHRVSQAATLYQADLALIEEHRRLPAATDQLLFTDIAGDLQPESVLLATGDGHPLRPLALSFTSATLTRQRLLEAFLGRRVTVVRTNPATGAETREEATILAASPEVILQVGNRVETTVAGRIVFPGLPPSLATQPRLSVTLADVPKEAPEIRLAYLTRGLSWRADYLAVLDESGERLAGLDCRATIVNDSGLALDNARVQLVAGQPHQAKAQTVPHRAYMAEARMAGAPAPAEREELASYHLYTLHRPVRVADYGHLQVELFGARDVLVRRTYRLRATPILYRAAGAHHDTPQPVEVLVHLANDEKSGLDLPLPAGTVRVYQPDRNGRLQFIGEDRISATPRGETATLRLGTAFDVTGRRRQTDFRVLETPIRNRRRIQSSHEIRLANGSDQPVTVQVEETLNGDWQILDESHPHQQPDSATAQWQLTVPAAGHTTLTYRVEVTR